MWQSVASSMMRAMRFNGNNTLDVEFNTGACFRYDNVTPEQFHDVVSATSVGKKFQELIRSQPGAHPFQPINKD